MRVTSKQFLATLALSLSCGCCKEYRFALQLGESTHPTNRAEARYLVGGEQHPHPNPLHLQDGSLESTLLGLALLPVLQIHWTLLTCNRSQILKRMVGPPPEGRSEAGEPGGTYG